MKKIICLVFFIIVILSFITILSSCEALGLGVSEHVLTKVDEVPPTCTDAGTGAYYVCSGCDLIFDDAEGKYKINAPKVLPTKHDLELVSAIQPTCEDGNKEHYACKNCEAIFADKEGKASIATAVVPAKHNPEIIPGKTSSCTEEGYSAYRVCKDCGEIITEPKILIAEHVATPTAELWGVSMEVIDGRAFLVIYGGNVANNVCEECGELVPLKISADFQHNSNIDGQGWSSPLVYADNNNFSSSVTEDTIQRPSSIAKVHGNLFEAYFDITELQAGSTLTIHAGLDGAMADLKNQGSGNGVAVYADGKKFSFRLDDSTWKIASIVVTEAAENEFNLNGRVNLEEIDGKPYIVYQGSWNTKNSNKAAVEAAINAGLSSTFDIMELNTWAKPAFEYILEVKDDGSITLALCLENLPVSTNPYYLHRAVGNSNSGGDIKLPTGHSYTITIGNTKYLIKKGSDAASWLSSFTVIFVSENQ